MMIEAVKRIEQIPDLKADSDYVNYFNEYFGKENKVRLAKLIELDAILLRAGFEPIILNEWDNLPDNIKEVNLERQLRSLEDIGMMRPLRQFNIIR